jgi:electron transfer flavoprotein alpha subunit
VSGVPGTRASSDGATVNGVLVIVECAGGQVSAASLGLLALARTLVPGGQSDVQVSALAFDSGAAMLDALAAHGADQILQPAVPLGARDGSEERLAFATQAAASVQASVVLLPHTAFGLDLAPRLAFRRGGMAVTGCVRIERGDDHRLRFTRLCQGGNVHERLRLHVVPAVATVRAGHYTALAPDPDRRAPTITLPPAIEPDAVARVRVLERSTTPADQQRLEDAPVIVAGGRGVGGPEGFEPLAQLARRLGGVVGASRVPCDLGWVPHSMQIGLSGRTVTPELYVAVGISGASHHLAGCGGARTLVAINSDPQAAIFRHARFGIVGDHGAIVPALIEALDSAQGRGDRQ